MKCRSCGANIKPVKDAKFIECPFCGTFNEIGLKKNSNSISNFAHINKKSLVTIYSVIFVLIIVGISISIFYKSNGNISSKEFYSIANLVNSNNDGVLDIVGIVGTINGGVRVSVIDGATGDILLKTKDKFDYNFISLVICPSEDYICYVKKDLTMDILSAKDLSFIGSVLLPDQIQKYLFSNDSLYLFFFDKSQIGINLKNGKNSHSNLKKPDKKSFLYSNLVHNQIDDEGVEYIATEKSGSKEFIVITAIKNDDTLWQTNLRYENVLITDNPCILLIDNTVLTYGTQLGDDDYAYVIGLDKTNGMIRYEMKQNSTWSNGLNSFLYNNKYLIATWGLGLHAYNPVTGERVWNIGGR